MEEVIKQLRSRNRLRMVETYSTTLRTFRRFCGERKVLLRDMDEELVGAFEADLVLRGLTKNTVSFYMRILRAVYNRAVERGYVQQRFPFRKVYTGVDKTVKRAMTICHIRRIRQLDLSDRPSLAWARDIFLFSFYTRGMSFVDIAYLRKTDLKGDLLVYRRRKTGQLMSVRWERCMQEIVARYEMMTASTPYLMPVLSSEEVTGMFTQYRQGLRVVNARLKRIMRLAKLQTPLTTYVARHSWASIAYGKHIPVSVISEGMGHDSETTTRIYLSSLEHTVIDRANASILKEVQ